MTEPAAIEALAEGFASGLHAALRAERPDLSWEVSVGPVDGAKGISPQTSVQDRAEVGREEG